MLRRAFNAPRLGAVAALLLAASVLTAPPASALGVPSGLSTGDVASGSQPILAWSRVKGAEKYEVEVTNDSTFGSYKWKTTTVNRRATPAVQLPVGAVWWRVRAVTGSTRSGWAEESFTRDLLAGPALQFPADGDELDQPEEPALLSWAPIHGATGYTIEVSQDENFSDPDVTDDYTTKNSSYVVPDPQVATTYYWRVRATLASGIATKWSNEGADPWSYKILGLAAPTLVGPPSQLVESIEDVVLEWQPVEGAKTYDLQISPNEEFQGELEGDDDITGTSYSPPENLGNDEYFWRVRPNDAHGNSLDWDLVEVWEFWKDWPDQPTLDYPANNATVGDPIHYQWTGVEHASSYTLQLSTSQTFNTLYDTCTTVHTTYVPAKTDDCWPGALGTYYWRVLATDAPGRTFDNATIVTEMINAPSRRFTYAPDVPQPLTPADGASVTVPTMRWEPVAGATKYRVTLTPTTGGSSSSFTTYGTSFTPQGSLTVGKTYRWTVAAVNGSRVGSTLLLGSQPTFTVAAAAAATEATPEPVGPASGESFRFPTLTWTPVVNADSYRILVRLAGNEAGGWSRLPDTFDYPAGADDTADYLEPETYEWMVEAYDDGVYLNKSQSAGTFTIANLPVVTGQRVANTGTALDSPATSCAETLPERCDGMRQTPVLAWDAVPDAGQYELYVARDRALTSLVSGFPTTVETNRFMDTDALVDGQAGAAYYWYVMPCKAEKSEPGCAPLALSGHAFNKVSNPVKLLSPAEGAELPNDVTFTWRDYLATNQDAGDPAVVDDTGVRSRVEAKQYRIQVATTPNFQSGTVVDERVVDQPTYTAFSTTYAEGPLSWRVQAIDGSGNNLTWSSTRNFVKRSPTPDLKGPINNQSGPGARTFRWEPLPFAGGYDIEVFKNGDTTGTLSNRVANGSSDQVAFSLTKPLPAASSSYTWRVRRVDAKGRKGGWTDLADPQARFRVSGSAPGLTGPADGAVVPARDGLFTWQATTDATSYRFERRQVGTSSGAESVKTVSLAYAPISTITDGSWQWRVTSVDSEGKDIASSAWRAFKVDRTAPRVTARSPATTANRSATFKATFSEPVTGVTGQTMRIYQSGKSGSLLATVKVAANRRSATLDPKKNLSSGKTYVVKLLTGIKDGVGNRLPATSWKVKVK